MNPALSWIGEQLTGLREQHLARGRRQVESLPGGWCVVEGRRLRNFADNDYLGLAHDPRLRHAAETAQRESGCGASASPLVSGRSRWMLELESAVARFEGSEGALVFPTGYAANLGTIPALVGPGDVILCDRYNHASLVDGCRLSGSRLRVYRHDDLDRLDRELSRAGDAPRRLIATDGVFSMDGDLAPLAELAEIARRRRAMLLVDEAHGTGVFGAAGRGACEALGVPEGAAIRVGTLSKSVGALGGFVAGDHALIEWLWNRARTQMYSTALPPAVCAAAAAGLEIIRTEPGLRRRLWANCRGLQGRLHASGIGTVETAPGPIFPLIVDDPERAVQIAAELDRRGFLVGAIRPPTVPRGTSRLRITLSAVHDETALDELAGALDEIWPMANRRRSAPTTSETPTAPR